MIHGKNIIGSELSANGNGVIQAVKALDYTVLSGDFVGATTEEVQLAVAKADKAFESYKNMNGKRKAEFLNAIAEEIEALGDTLIQRASLESGLPVGRITGERGRTMGQLRAFATLLEEGSWVEARIEKAQPERQPMPKADIRKMLFPVGPVVVFGASNFPLAFSTAGGDTASALAAGCPVIVKAHNGHLGTNELVSSAIIKAAKRTNMPEGVFSSLNSTDFSVGEQLVSAPTMKAVGFTGSYNGGKALFNIANNRANPIPVYAEMGSVNPVLFLADELNKNTEALAKTYAGSITMGVGQFCTNPGLLIAVKSDALNSFKENLSTEIQNIPQATMLNQGIAENFDKMCKATLSENGVNTIVTTDVVNNQFGGTIATVSAADFIANPQLKEEVFGPFSLIVEADNDAQVKDVLKTMEGQLTISVMGNDSDFEKHNDLVNFSKELAGRVIFNAAPTGVEVCYAMHHGGSFPASTDGKFTSVGQDAIKRFVRPISLQSAPNAFLPEELQNNNPLNIMRIVDGVYTKDEI